MAAERQPITIRDVAAAASVSVSTVSRVLTGSVPVTEDKRAAVLAAIEKLRFHPNLAAQGLVRGRSWEIGVLAQGIASPFYSPMLAGISTGLSETGYQPIFAEAHSDDLVIRALDSFAQRHVDAVIVVGGQSNDDLLLDVAARIPLVALSRTLPGREAQCLQVSSRDGARAAIRHLLQLGHTRIVHVLGPTAHSHAVERQQGYLSALAEAGIEPDPALLVQGEFHEASGLLAMETIVERGVSWSAVFASNDQMAYGVLLGLHKHGLRVPEDVSVVGFDDQWAAAYTTPPLTTVRQPAEEMGRAAAEGVLRVLRGEPLALPIFSADLVVRESTAPFHPGARRKAARAR